MNGSISPQIAILTAANTGGYQTTGTSIYAAADTIPNLAEGVYAIIDSDTGLSVDARDEATIKAKRAWQLCVANNKDVTGKEAKLLIPIINAKVSAFKKIAYSAPVYQTTVIGATIGDAIDNGGTLTSGKYYICIASGTMTTATTTLTHIWSASNGTLANIPAATGSPVVVGDIYLGATGDGTVNAAGAANLFAELTSETVMSSLSTGAISNIYIQDNSKLHINGKLEPGDLRFYSSEKTTTNTESLMIADMVTQINNSNPVCRAIQLGATQTVVLSSIVAGDRFIVKCGYEYLSATVTDKIMPSKGEGTYAQMVETIKIAGYNTGGGTGSYELQNVYYPAFANEVAKLGATSSTFTQYHIRYTTDRSNAFGVKQDVASIDTFIIVATTNTTAIAELDALLAVY